MNILYNRFTQTDGTIKEFGTTGKKILLIRTLTGVITLAYK